MGIAHLADHTAIIWHKLETLGPARETEKSFPTFSGPFDCKADRKKAIQSDAGPGMWGAGLRTIFFDIGPAIGDRDLVELVTGPDAPAMLEVESVTRPRDHHIEVRVSEYRGAYPDLGS